MNPLRIAPDHGSQGIHAASSAYASSVWLPVLGPTGFLLWSRLSAVATSTGAVTPDQLCADLGLGGHDGRQSALARSLRRLEVFHITRTVAEDRLLVCTELDWVPDRHLRRLHPAVIHRHRRFLDLARETDRSRQLHPAAGTASTTAS